MTMFYAVIAVAVGFVIVMWMVLRSGHGYSIHDTEAHSTSYVDIIREGHGGLTLCLVVSFVAIFIWTIVYLVQHWSEFSAMFGM